MKTALWNENLAENVRQLRRGDSDSTVIGICYVTGEVLLALVRNGEKKVALITGVPGKWSEGERMADGFVVAKSQSNI